MKIGIFQDVHANLPALQRALSYFHQMKCDKIVHVGDLIGIGPYPKEVMGLAMNSDNLTLIMGNHDYWYGFGLPNPQPSFMSEEELLHQRWTHHQIGNDYRHLVQKWKFVEEWSLKSGSNVGFQHYGYDQKANWFKAFLKEPDARKLDLLFIERHSDIIFYGHHHTASDIEGRCRYVNLGSAGCYSEPQVRLGVLNCTKEGWTLEKVTLDYDDNGLMEEFDRRKVPARDFVRANFITRTWW